MKKLLTAILATGMLTLTAIPVYAAVQAPYVCPNGNTACVQNGACLNDGTCTYNGTCSGMGTCAEYGVCQYPENCPNGGTPRQDGTGYQNGGHHGGGRGGRHCGR